MILDSYKVGVYWLPLSCLESANDYGLLQSGCLLVTPVISGLPMIMDCYKVGVYWLSLSCVGSANDHELLQGGCLLVIPVMPWVCQ